MLNHTQLWTETEELADLILDAPEVTAYQEAEKKMKAHPHAESLMNTLREVQEEVAEFQARRVPPKHFVHLLQKTESIMEELEKIPEVVAFQQAQSAVNELLQEVTTRLAKAVLEKVTDKANG